MQILFGQEQADNGTPGWTLHTGTGDRVFDRAVTFQSPLLAPPLVQVTLSLIDAAKEANLRVDVQAVNITNTGFKIRFHTWADTKLWFVRASWIAIAP